jgi:hypothetical protein
MDFLILEVDGSLANPFVAATVLVWTAVLSGIAVAAVRQFAESRRAWPAWTLVLAVAVLITKQGQLSIGHVLYRIVDPGITDVGFWGGPPVWIAPVVSCSVGLLASAVVLYRRRQC